MDRKNQNKNTKDYIKQISKFVQPEALPLINQVIEMSFSDGRAYQLEKTLMDLQKKAQSDSAPPVSIDN